MGAGCAGDGLCVLAAGGTLCARRGSGRVSRGAAPRGAAAELSPRTARGRGGLTQCAGRCPAQSFECAVS